MHASLSRFVASLAVAAALLGLGAMPAARAEVVFGNLGNAGTGTLGSTVTDFGNNPPITDFTQRLAVGFTTGTLSNSLKLQSVTLGLFGSTPPAVPVNISVRIYGDDGGKPDTTVDPLFTSGSLAIGDTDKYTFSFPGSPQLSASTTYWIVPEPVTVGSWVNNLSSSAPIGRNGSGYAFLSALRYGIEEEDDPTLGWFSAPTTGMAVSIQAVPEPSTFVLMATALGLGCVAAIRRRRA